MFAAVILTLATQWLFGRCRRNNNPITITEEQRTDQQEESSDEFEIVSNEEVEEAQTEEVEETQTEEPTGITESMEETKRDTNTTDP